MAQPSESPPPVPIPAGHVELRFLIPDSSKTIHHILPKSSTVQAVKTKIVGEWPDTLSPLPSRSPDVLKLIHAGKLLDAARTLEECGVKEGERVSMHLVVKPSAQGAPPKAAPGAPPKAAANSRCSCIVS
eukprot:tig00000507_g1776.t1